LCSTWTLVILFTLTGISVASYHQYPEKVQAVLDVLPPQAIVYFDTVKDTTVHYGKIVSAKSADFILDGIDMASDGYGMVHPYIQKAVDGTKDTLGPYIGPYVGPYWDAFYNHVAEMYKESNALAREWTREINIGEINLEQFLFKEEIEKERLEKAKLAAEKKKEERLAREVLEKIHGTPGYPEATGAEGAETSTGGTDANEVVYNICNERFDEYDFGEALAASPDVLNEFSRQACEILYQENKLIVEEPERTKIEEKARMPEYNETTTIA